MKMPELPKRKPKAQTPGSGSASRVQAPAFVQDLYKDMRDRRLIIPAVALLVAIVAVPIVLSSPSESSVTPPAPVSDPDAVAVEPAVLTVQEIGVRDYRERLSELEQKNPFGSRFEPKPDKKLEDADDTQAGGAPSVSGGSSGSASPVPTGGSGTPSPGTAPPTTGTPTEPMIVVSRIDAMTKIVGRDQSETHEDVHSGDVLPSKQAPVVLFLRNVDAGTAAQFIVSRNVSKVTGEGTCKPGKTNCEFLSLEEGETAYLRYRDGNRYALRVSDIRFEHIPESEFDQSD
jgi:hypothetical protein